MRRKYHEIDDVLRNTVLTPTGCMEWAGGVNKDGYACCAKYGLFESNLVHREVYRLSTGQTPEVVMHVCDNRRCINPTHLRGGTHVDNLRDKVKKNRQARGQTNGNSVLTDADVLRMRELRANGAAYALLQAQFNVSRATVWRVVSGKNWRHVCR